MITNVKSNIKSLKLNEEDKSLIVLPMYFGYCNSSQFLTHMYLGASVVIAPQPFNPARFLSFIEKYSITNTTCIPSMLFLTIAMKKKYDLESWKIRSQLYAKEMSEKKAFEIRLEDLTMDPYGELKKLMNYLELDVSPEQIRILNECYKQKKGKEYSIYRKKEDVLTDWKKYLNNNQIEIVKEKLSKEINNYGYN